MQEWWEVWTELSWIRLRVGDSGLGMVRCSFLPFTSCKLERWGQYRTPPAGILLAWTRVSQIQLAAFGLGAT